MTVPAQLSSYNYQMDTAPPVFPRQATAPGTDSGMHHHIYRIGLVLVAALVAGGLTAGTANAMAKKEEQRKEPGISICNYWPHAEHEGLMCYFLGE